MISCPICAITRRDEVAAMLEGVGVDGAAMAAVHEVLVPCTPDEACLERIGQAVRDAAADLADPAAGGDDGSGAAAAALLVLLESLDEVPLDSIAARMCTECAGRCDRKGPGGKMWRKAITVLRDRLIDGGEGRQLLVECVVRPAGPALVVEQQARDTTVTSALVLPAVVAARHADVATRLRRLAVLAIVKKVGRSVSAAKKNPLRIRGLRLRGDTRAWSAFHNTLAGTRPRVPAS